MKNEKFGNFSTSYFFRLRVFLAPWSFCITLTPHHSDRSPLCPCCPHQSPLGVSLRQTSLSLNENIDLKKPDVFCGAGDRELQLYSIQMSQIFWSESTLRSFLFCKREQDQKFSIAPQLISVNKLITDKKKDRWKTWQFIFLWIFVNFSSFVLI